MFKFCSKLLFLYLTPPRFAVLPFLKRGDYPLMKNSKTDNQSKKCLINSCFGLSEAAISPFEKGEYPDRGEGLEF